MPKVGIRELKNTASEIIRAVREEQVEYTITYHGEPVAVIQHVDAASSASSEEDILAEARRQADYWARWDALAAEIDANWTSDMSALEAVEAQRRDT